MGRVAFLEPEISIVPLRVLPPWILSASMAGDLWLRFASVNGGPRYGDLPRASSLLDTEVMSTTYEAYERVAVLGGGSFGTALAHLSAREGQKVRLWMRDAEQAATLNETGRNPRYLSDLDLHRGIVATADLSEALADAQWVIVAVPSQSVRTVLTSARELIGEAPLVLAAKGIETDTLMTMDEVTLDVLGAQCGERILALSGPSFAREIVLNQPTAVVLACRDEVLAGRVCDLLFSDTFRAYSTSDLVGVEMGGALKNVVAIAAGMVTGMGFGHNSRATLVTRGLAEITRVAVAKGGNPLTLAGLSGVGDLLLTCTGGLSRNRAVGQALGEGKTLDEALEIIGEVAEGVRTTKSAYDLARKIDVETPIIDGIYKVLYEGMSMHEGFLGLVRRHPGSELEYRDT